MSITNKNESLDSLAEKLVDIVLAENIFDKNIVYEKIRIALSLWTRKNTRRKNLNKIKTSKQILAVTLEKERFERTFWYDVFKELVKKEDRQIYYDKFHNELSEAGFSKFSKNVHKDTKN